MILDNETARANFSRNATAIAKERGLNARAIAAKTNDPYVSVYEALRGTKTANYALASRIADVLGVSLDLLIRSEEISVK